MNSMITLFYLSLFLISIASLYFASELVIKNLIAFSKFIGWREFIVSFFIMSTTASLPNLFLGITSALNKIPELSFGDIIGGNLVDLTLVVALAILVGNTNIPAQSRTVQTTSIFTLIAGILPLVLSFDGEISRIDGILLIGLFIIYNFWLFSKKERFTRVYDGKEESISISEGIRDFFINIGKTILGITLLLLASQGIVFSSKFIVEKFNFSLILFGAIVVGLLNAFPEASFSIVSARKKESWMILGNLMGSVIVCATLVLGMVALIHPIKISSLYYIAVARIFLIIASILFFFFVRTDRKITKREAYFLLGIYVLFIFFEALIK